MQFVVGRGEAEVLVEREVGGHAAPCGRRKREYCFPASGSFGGSMDDGLPVTAVEAWLRECTGARSVAVQRRPGGGRHQAWDVTLAAADGATDRRFLRADAVRPGPHESYTLWREAEIYAALAGAGLPVPDILAVHPDHPAVLMAYARRRARASAASTRPRRWRSSTSWSTRWCACTASTSRRSRCRRSSPRGASPITCATSSTCGRAASTRAAGRSPSCAAASPGCGRTSPPSTARRRWCRATPARATSSTTASTSPRCSTSSSPTWATRWRTWRGSAPATRRSRCPTSTRCSPPTHVPAA